MDLTKEFPRSVHEKVHGLVQIGRAIDKGKALAHGNIGEYNFNCPMDIAVFTFLGVDHDALFDVIKNAKNDDEIYAYVKTFIDKKTPEEIERWNQEWVSRQPQGESLAYFLNLRNQVAPERTDVMTWADLLDLDEKRSVPLRVTANA